MSVHGKGDQVSLNERLILQGSPVQYCTTVCLNFQHINKNKGVQPAIIPVRFGFRFSLFYLVPFRFHFMRTR